MKPQMKQRRSTKIESFKEVKMNVMKFKEAANDAKKAIKPTEATRMLLPLDKLAVGRTYIVPKSKEDTSTTQEFLNRMKTLASNAQAWAEENLGEVRNYRAYLIVTGDDAGKIAIGRIQDGMQHRRQKRA